MITKTCPECEKEFEKKTWNQKYCSRICTVKNNHKLPLIKKACDECGVEFKVYPYRSITAKYCSYKCAGKAKVNGKQKPIKDKYGRSNRHDDKIWQTAVRGKDYSKCKRCGVYQVYIHTHHIKPRSRYPELKYNVDNGICLCNSCHSWVHNHPKDAHEKGYLYVGKYNV